MKRKSLINGVLQNIHKPERFFGRMTFWGMNQGYVSLAHWGMSYTEWHQEWNVLDIGCGNGASLAQILKYCPQGKTLGIDTLPESVTFARKRNKGQLGTRCFVEQGSVDQLLCSDYSFDMVTAFETIYFWSGLQHTFTEMTCVLKPGGVFLVCCKMSDLTNEVWTSRVEEMVAYSEDRPKVIPVNAGLTNTAIYRRRREGLYIIGHKKMMQL